ncbi:hypothetical protein ACRE_078340 [Hapsidospora chrysogenum ATCC 11550]|uniref:Uncharacterized protein n=1 Tax=Hapsidospora chrysogenum (strain ATCC 11550 / CBS 779.69 / DSM 880 / IAM 14645 / JCM 23072 / IMI 49137) TaxID=857340 RepID=A0A086SWH2_HAPC1|nr:hypothetical protein ACRE_078340 [Hapsidospora chrysogenum ATCC 11550]
MPSTTLPKPTPSHPAPAPASAPAPNLPTDEAPFHTIDLELGLPHEKPQQPLPPHQGTTQRDICNRRRAQHARSKRKQCRRARRQQIVIALIVLSVIGGMSPLVALALNQ